MEPAVCTRVGHERDPIVTDLSGTLEFLILGCRERGRRGRGSLSDIDADDEDFDVPESATVGKRFQIELADMDTRERGIQQLMTVNLLKRLESSVEAFRITLRKVETGVEHALGALDSHDDSQADLGASEAARRSR